MQARFLLEISVPVEDLRARVLRNVHRQELFEFISQVGGPALAADRAEGRMSKGILHVWQCIVL